MNTHEKLIATYSEIEAIQTRNTPAKDGKRLEGLVGQTLELMRKRMAEVAGKDKALLDYIVLGSI